VAVRSCCAAPKGARAEHRDGRTTLPPTTQRPNSVEVAFRLWSPDHLEDIQLQRDLVLRAPCAWPAHGVRRVRQQGVSILTIVTRRSRKAPEYQLHESVEVNAQMTDRFTRLAAGDAELLVFRRSTSRSKSSGDICADRVRRIRQSVPFVSADAEDSSMRRSSSSTTWSDASKGEIAVIAHAAIVGRGSRHHHAALRSKPLTHWSIAPFGRRALQPSPPIAGSEILHFPVSILPAYRYASPSTLTVKSYHPWVDAVSMLATDVAPAPRLDRLSGVP
jgi:hypothetical protein